MTRRLARTEHSFTVACATTHVTQNDKSIENILYC